MAPFPLGTIATYYAGRYGCPYLRRVFEDESPSQVG